MNGTTFAFPLALVALATGAGVPTPALAATTHTVTDCGDTGAPGQLRSVITAAAAGDTVEIAACTVTLTAPASPLTVSVDLTIRGAGPSATVIDGADITQLFNVVAGVVTIADLTVRNGTAPSVGGAIVVGLATVALTNTVVRDSRSGSAGGGIFTNGAVTLTGSRVTGNVAGGSPGSGAGGGIFSNAPVTLVDSTVSDNVAAADASFGGTGGGIFSNDEVTLIDSTVSGNHAEGTPASGGKGGGLFANSTLTLTNSTVSGNVAAAGSGNTGGGIRANDLLTMTSSTVAGNAAPDGAGGGIFADNPSANSLRSTILADNTGVTRNCSQPLVSLGHNLEDADECGLDPALGDLPNTDPRLAPLASNAGLTQTHALLPDSPAIDAGDPAACPATDQRGVQRPLDGDADGTVACDVGAYERIFVDAGLALALALDQPSYASGETLAADVTAANPTGPAVPADVYMGFRPTPSGGGPPGCPAGDALVFILPGFVDVAIHCLSDPVSAFPRLLEQVTVPAGFPTTVVADFFTATVAGAPPGIYTLFLVLTVPNAFADGELGPEDLIRVAVVTFTIR
jgi:hypothetical protein